MRPNPYPEVGMETSHHLFDGVDGWVNLFARAPCCYDVIWSCPTDDLSGVAAFVRDLGDDMDLYFSCATRNRQLIGVRGRKEDCLLLPVLFADLDVADPARHRGEKQYPAQP